MTQLPPLRPGQPVPPTQVVLRGEGLWATDGHEQVWLGKAPVVVRTRVAEPDRGVHWPSLLLGAFLATLLLAGAAVGLALAVLS